jgi:hypothetical protein
MLRAAALSLLVLFSIAVLLPLTRSSAEDNERPAATRRYKRVRRHSRAWWRRYRARLRRQRAALERERALAALRDQQSEAVDKGRAETAISPRAFSATGGVFNDPRGAFSLTMPQGWSSRPVISNGEMRFRLFTPDGRPAGQATLSVVSVSPSGGAALSARARRRMLAGGVQFADLRRTVIDKMVAANGWVINDLEREIGGRRVYVVFAQTAASEDGRAPQAAWVFYFTEMGGRIYSLVTNAPLEFSERIAAESEQVMASFRAARPPSTVETSRY